MNNEWYLYTHTRLDKNEIFYVGIGKQKNFARAYVKYKSERNSIWIKITKKTDYRVDILLKELTKEEAAETERYLISYYGRIDLGTGRLCNMTGGGDGMWNTPMTEDNKKKLSENMMGAKNHMFGKKQSAETIAARSKSNTGKKRSDEHNKRASINNTQRIEVDVYNYTTNEFIGSYHSISEAARQLNCSNSKASLVLNGKRMQHKNYTFKKKVA